MRKEQLNKSRLAFLLVVYFIILAWMVIFKCNVNSFLGPGTNLERETIFDRLRWIIPFKSYAVKISQGYIWEFITFVVNFFVFIPMGILLPFFIKKKKSLWTIFFVVLSIEIFQLIIGWGGYDTTDVIMCSLGGALGVWIYKILRPRISNRTINKLALCLSVIGGVVSVFAIVNTALNFPPIYLVKWA